MPNIQSTKCVIIVKIKNIENGTHRIKLNGNSKYTLLANGCLTTHKAHERNYYYSNQGRFLIYGTKDSNDLAKE
jgi:hypothetical protein